MGGKANHPFMEGLTLHGKLRLALVTIAICFAISPVSFGDEQKTQPENGETRLLPADYDAWSCDVSPNGGRIVFSGKPKGEDSTKMRVWLADPTGGNPVLWTNTDGLMDGAPRWSPTGDGVIMVRKTKLDVDQQSMGLGSSIWWKAYPDGQGLQLTLGTNDKDPSWSPDGQSIVFVRGEGALGGESLVIMDRNGQRQQILIQGDGDMLADPAWGRDGWIYYTRFKPKRRVLSNAGKDYEVFVPEKGILERIQPETGRSETFLDNSDDNRSPVLSPDGRFLAFISTRGARAVSGRIYDRGALWIMTLKDKSLRLISDRVGLNGTPPVWSPQGDRLIFFSFRQIRPALWSVNLQ